MTLPCTVGEILSEHTILKVESLDRMYLAHALLCEGVAAVRWAGIGLITAGVFLVSGT